MIAPNRTINVAWPYSRFSNLKQKKGDSIRRQQAPREQYLAQIGLPLDTSLDLDDLGVSAFRGKNAKQGGLSNFLAAIKAGRVIPGDHLLVENLDRLSRQELADAEEIVLGILKAGVTIATFLPHLKVYTPEDRNNLVKRIEMIVDLKRAHEESLLKSKRVGESWETRRANAGDKPMSGRCPCWMKPEKGGWKLIAKNVAVMRRLFAMAETLGSTAIATKLNREKVPPIGGRSKKWTSSGVTKLTTVRTVLGEMQPHTTLQDGSRVPAGPAHKNYYPRIISDKQFNKVQAARKARAIKGGPSTKRISNLFTGLVVDSQGERLSYHHGYQGYDYLNSENLGVPYELIEKSMLIWLPDLSIAEVANPTSKHSRQRRAELLDEIDAEEVGKAALNETIAKYKKLKKTKSLSPLYEQLVEAQARIDEANEEIEKIDVETSNTSTESLRQLHELLATGQDNYETRARLRHAISRLVNRIEIKAERHDHSWSYSIDLTIELANKKTRRVLIEGTEVFWGKGIPKVPAQKKKLSPKHTSFRRDLVEDYPELARYSAPSFTLADLVEMREKKKMSFANIAKEVGTFERRVVQMFRDAGLSTDRIDR